MKHILASILFVAMLNVAGASTQNLITNRERQYSTYRHSPHEIFVLEKQPILEYSTPKDEDEINKLSATELDCLTDNVYHEARGESEEGWKAVVAVVFNRLEDPRWPSTICGVIRQRAAFSWTFRNPKIGNRRLWQEIRNKITDWTNNGFVSQVYDATHYHTIFISPTWSRKRNLMVHRGIIGDHKFYLEKE